MEIILITAFCAAALLVAHRVGELGPDRARAGTWKSAAAACRLEGVVTNERLGARVLGGTRGPLSVRLHSLSGTVSGRAGTRITLTGLSPRLSISPAEEERDDVRVGDRHFDRALQLRGEPFEIQAILDVQTRSHLRALFATRDGLGGGHRLVSIEGGQLVVDCWDSPVATRAERLAVALEDALTLGQRLVDPPAAEERLGAIFRDDPEPKVRLRALKTLADERPDHPATHAAARAALGSEDDEIRLVGALASGAEGRETLRAMAGSPAIDDAVSAKAMTALRDELDLAAVRGSLSAAVASWRTETAVACFEVLCHRGAPHPEFSANVLQTLPVSIALPVVRALGHAGSAAAEPALLRALWHTDIGVRLAAADSLGRVGTADAVPALRRLEQQVVFAGENVRVVNAAIASIQSRLLGAEHGQLALAAERGEVSLAEDPSGRVSVEGSRPD
jgi:hypothetical protein